MSDFKSGTLGRLSGEREKKKKGKKEEGRERGGKVRRKEGGKEDGKEG